MSPRRSRAAPEPPPLAERQKPGLSETLTHQKHPQFCQSCGDEHYKENPLTRWIEHDAWDKPLNPPVVVVLCDRCGKRLIEPHPRLYKLLWPGEPFPGCMSVCITCTHRVGVSCKSELAQLNGGPGLKYRWASEPSPAHINYGGGRGEMRMIFHGPVLECSGHHSEEHDECCDTRSG